MRLLEEPHPIFKLEQESWKIAFVWAKTRFALNLLNNALWTFVLGKQARSYLQQVGPTTLVGKWSLIVQKDLEFAPQTLVVSVEVECLAPWWHLKLGSWIQRVIIPCSMICSRIMWEQGVIIGFRDPMMIIPCSPLILEHIIEQGIITLWIQEPSFSCLHGAGYSLSKHNHQCPSEVAHPNGGYWVMWSCLGLQKSNP